MENSLRDALLCARTRAVTLDLAVQAHRTVG